MTPPAFSGWNWPYGVHSITMYRQIWQCGPAQSSRAGLWKTRIKTPHLAPFHQAQYVLEGVLASSRTGSARIGVPGGRVPHLHRAPVNCCTGIILYSRRDVLQSPIDSIVHFPGRGVANIHKVLRSIGGGNSFCLLFPAAGSLLGFCSI